MPNRSMLPDARGVRRSAALVRAFRLEQTEPERFYATLADDSVRRIRKHGSLTGRLVVDVGAGPPQFAEAFHEAGSRYVAVDADPDELTRSQLPGCSSVLAQGERLPFPDSCADVAFSSNVWEHVEQPEALGAELLRIVQPGGLVVVSYTNWMSPWGGHETSPFHYLGGERAIRIYTRRYGHAPKNRVGVNLHRVSVAAGLRWARGRRDATVLEAAPRYYPDWARGVVRVPGLREVVTWNLWLVLRRR